MHARLNKLITSRLPLALPPYSGNPEAYARGINSFAQIYNVFEARWHNLIAQQEAGEVGHSAHHAEVQEWLADLVPSGLWRSAVIQSDLEQMSKTLDISLSAADGTIPRDKELVEHILEITTAKPHTLVAYAWIMYMAIFSGGRWVRQQLAQGGPTFWHAKPPESGKSQFGSPNHPVPGFSLFYFEGERDGEDIKADFKAKLEHAEALLSEKERRDIVEEAHVIFESCIALVERLDMELGTASRLPEVDSDLALAKGKAGHDQTIVVTTRNSMASVSSLLTTLLVLGLASLTAWFWMGFI